MTEKPKPFLMIDRTVGLLHENTCPVLLLTRDHDVESFEGLEHAIRDRELRWCSCALAFFARSAAGIFAGLRPHARDAAQLAGLEILVRHMTETADMFDRGIADFAAQHVGDVDGEPGN